MPVGLGVASGLGLSILARCAQTPHPDGRHDARSPNLVVLTVPSQ